MLCNYHRHLMQLGLTTNEEYKDVYLGNQASPFTRYDLILSDRNSFGYFANMIRMYCRKLSKKLFDPELMYQPIKLAAVEVDINDVTKQGLADAQKLAVAQPKNVPIVSSSTVGSNQNASNDNVGKKDPNDNKSIAPVPAVTTPAVVVVPPVSPNTKNKPAPQNIHNTNEAESKKQDALLETKTNNKDELVSENQPVSNSQIEIVIKND